MCLHLSCHVILLDPFQKKIEHPTWRSSFDGLVVQLCPFRQQPADWVSLIPDAVMLC
jgi:hypothetical protein